MAVRESKIKALANYPTLAAYTKPVKKAERKIVGREAEIRKLRAAMMRPELCNAILLAEAGSGKAHPVDTWLPVADERGYIRIGDVKVGDMVFDENGEPTRVVGVFPQGMLRVFDVRFADGSTVPCNDEHLWNARSAWDHYNERPYRTLTLRAMLEEGIRKHVVRRDGRESYGTKWYIPANKAVNRPRRDLPIDPYALGVFLGDGCLTDRPLTVSSSDEAVVRRVGALIGAVDVEKSPHNYSWHFLKSPRGLNGEVSLFQTHEMADLLPGATVFGHKSVERRIPKEYMLASVEQRMELLRGLLDTDGCVSGDVGRVNVSFASNNEGLARDVRELAASLGMRTSLSWQDREDAVHKNREYEVCFRVDDDDKEDLFWLERHKTKVRARRRDGKRFRRHFDDLAVSEVVDTGRDEEMVCIYVESPSHLFQVGKEHIVTHNTALVQGTMVVDEDRLYLEVDLARMIAGLSDSSEMAALLKKLFDEVADYVRDQMQEVVLFIDEFHQVVQLSAAAVEALKPLLADSGTRGIRVIAATTYEEFRKYISPNQPLVERLQRINLPQPTKEMTVAILHGMAERYGVAAQFSDDSMFEQIYEYTQRYIPASAQPRKSLLVLDAMVGYHRAEGRKMDMSLLADVIYQSEGVNVAFRVDATQIKAELDKHVLSQKFATTMIQQRLQICVADLNNKGRPMSSFLFSGSTGVGKSEVCKQLARILFESERNLIIMDMTEYANPDSLERFRRELTNRVWARPYSIVLLDEIEKACAPVTRLLLQVLDDGRLSDENNRIVSFVNCYIVLTTNAGSEIYKTIAQYNADDEGSGKDIMKYNKVIRESITKTTGDNRFPPELLGRIDCVVPFQPLSEETMKQIVMMNLRKLSNEVRAKHGVEIKFSKDIVRYLVEDTMDTDSDAGGARAVKSKLESEVTVSVAEYINAHPNDKNLLVYVEGLLVRDNKNSRMSNAYVVVKADDGKTQSRR